MRDALNAQVDIATGQDFYARASERPLLMRMADGNMGPVGSAALMLDTTRPPEHVLGFIYGVSGRAQ